ncbi:MAG: hypothetical protein LBM65_02235 [Oscillospiraceae bacterium]|jgi:hypothetical protein|nr:hypothetical protein [Oscillospiraceae bacterium]
MKTKLVLLLLCLTLLSSATVISVGAATGLNILLKADKTTAKIGDVITLSVLLDNYSDSSIADIGGLQIDVPINTEYFEYINGSGKSLLKTHSGDFASSSFNESKKQFTLMYAYMNTDAKALPRENNQILSLQVRVIKELLGNEIITLSCKVAIASTDSPSKPLSATVIPVQIKSDTYKAANKPTENSANSQPSTTNSGQAKQPAATTNSVATTSGSALSEQPVIVVPLTPEDKLPWDSAVIKNNDGTKVTAEKTDEGIVLNSSNLNGTQIEFKKGNETAKLTIDTDEKEVLIKEKDDGSVAAYADSDDDGEYDSELSETKYSQTPYALFIILSIAAVAIAVIMLFVAYMHRKKIMADKTNE